MKRRKPRKQILCEPVGECIYCGSHAGDLTDEHVIPAGLGGTWVLPSASCSACAIVTSRFEGQVLRGVLSAPRAALDMFTRRPMQRPETLPLSVNGVEMQVARDAYPTNLSLPEFDQPAYVLGIIRPPAVYLRGLALHVDGHRLRRIALGAAEESVGGNSAARTVAVSWADAYGRNEHTAFLRLLLKIGYCTLVGTEGIRAVDSRFARSLILGHNDQISHFVGTVPMDYPAALLPEAVFAEALKTMNEHEEEWHRVTRDRSRGVWQCYIQLFRPFFAYSPPIYQVVVGAASP